MKIKAISFNLMALVILTAGIPVQKIEAINSKVIAYGAALCASAGLGVFTVSVARGRVVKTASELKEQCIKMLAVKVINNNLIALRGLKAEVAIYLGENVVANLEERIDESALKDGRIHSYSAQPRDTTQYLNSISFHELKGEIMANAWWHFTAWLKPSYAFLCGAYAELYVRSKILAVYTAQKEAQQEKQWDQKIDKIKSASESAQ